MIVLYKIELQHTNQDYEAKLAEGKHGNEMNALVWDIKELEDLNEKGRSLVIQCSILKDRHLDHTYDIIANNMALQLSKLREDVFSFVKRATKYKREAATPHVLNC